MRKVLAASVLLAVGLALFYSYFSFSGPNQKVEDLWYPPFHTQELDSSDSDLVVAAGGSEETGLILPVNKSDVSFRNLGVWPFGVSGGDHPFGHPGIDFEALVGTPIIAAASGKVSYIGDSDHYDQKTFNIHVTTHDLIYTGPMEVVVTEGQEVSRGDVVAYMEAWLGEGDVGYLHFGVSKVPTRENLCPVEFFTDEAAAEMDELHKMSLYAEREEFPLVCNPCPEGGCR